ncbi:VWA domain containing CoxE-like protein [Stieleria bergensis]|uniref:VWA domain containing CoxE-like protein n=1 Tax=Stieleria bergensis TaxID=2528025 RepID=A0A517ST58_9BACT|nr:VWA domain containing CoxE-like protein [Planctomycetes bacterium SV_7m_r]
MTQASTSNSELEQLFWARPLETPLMIAAFAAVLLWSLYLYRRSWGLSPWLRFTLGFARLLVLLLIVAALFEPMAVVRETRTSQRTLPVLIDVSESMSIIDPRRRSVDLAEAATALNLVVPSAEDISLNLDSQQRQLIATSTRLNLATTLLSETAQPTLETLGQSLDVSYHAFGEESRLISDSIALTAKDAASLNAQASQTSITNALKSVTTSGAGPTAGVVILSDGLETGSSQEAEAVLQDLSARGIPVFTVPLGLSDPDDVSIQSIVMQEVAYSGDKVPVRVQLQSKGYEKRTATLSVMLNDRRVSSRTVRFEGGLQFEDIDFRVDVYDKGAAEIEIKIEAFNDEVSVENNRVLRSIRVVNEKVNVLYIEGNARWEYRYLRAILKRDPRINATFIASNVGPEVARNSTEHIERFPNNREEAFQYDLVILGDVDAAFFTDDEFGLLEELVRDRGASLLMLCGPMYSPTSYQNTPVQAMLPVRFEPEGRWEEVADSVYPGLTAEGASSLVMTLENDPDSNDRVWSRMAPMDHLPPLLGPKSGATVLTVLSDSVDRDQGYPLVAWQRYGTGKCMSIATDRLWRLRYRTGDKYHWRVWSQCIQFMTLSRLMGEHKRIRLETDRAIYNLGNQCRLYAHVLDDNFDPVLQPEFDVFVVSMDEGESQTRISLRPDRSQPGLYEGYFAPQTSGRFRLESTADDQEISNTTEFQVANINPELTDTNTDVAHLKRIAKLTGGQCLTIQEFATLPSFIDQSPVTATVRTERSLWDNSWIACLLIGLLGIEWIQRRRHDLP